MSQATAHKTVDAPIETVWGLISDYEGMSSWAPGLSVTVRHVIGDEPNGVGAVRTITGRLPTPPIVEEITAFEAPTRLAYRGVSGVPLRGYAGEIVLVSTGAGGTSISYTVRGTLPVPGVAGLLCRGLAGALCGAVAKAVAKQAA